MRKTVKSAGAVKGDAATRLASSGWKLEDAKARFSEVVRLARSEGPQRVSVRGREAVVVISVEQLEQLAPRKPQVPFIQFMEGLHFGELDLAREQHRGRDVQL